jgi:Putative Ig domain
MPLKVASGNVPKTIGSDGSDKGVGTMRSKLTRLASLSVFCLAGLLLLPTTAQAATTATLTVAPPQSITNLATFSSIACPSATTCEAIGYNQSGYGTDYVVTITNGVVQSQKAVTGSSNLGSIACVSASTCYALGTSSSSQLNGLLVPISNGVPGTGTIIPDYPDWSSITCPTAVTCEAVGPDGVLTIANGVPAAPVAIPGQYALGQVSCETATTCFAAETDEQGPPTAFVLAIASGVPVAEIPSGLPAASYFYGIDCVSSTTCQITGKDDIGTATQGLTVTLTNGALGTVETNTSIDELGAITCPTANVCVALASIAAVSAGVLPITDGAIGQVTPIPSIANYSDVACVTATSCISVGQGAFGIIEPITVTPPLSIATSSLAGATVNSSYSATLSATGGKTPYTWSLTSGALPPGLKLSSAGVISGTPTTAGTYNFTVGVSDTSSPAQSTTAPESITVSQANSLSPLQAFFDFLLYLLGLLHLI